MRKKIRYQRHHAPTKSEMEIEAGKFRVQMHRSICECALRLSYYAEYLSQFLWKTVPAFSQFLFFIYQIQLIFLKQSPEAFLLPILQQCSQKDNLQGATVVAVNLHISQLTWTWTSRYWLQFICDSHRTSLSCDNYSNEFSQGLVTFSKYSVTYIFS